MEGDEFCSLYFESKAFFGVSTIQAGMKGAVDVGHKDAYEVFYVTAGRILCYLPNEGAHKELNKGDAILIPPNMPHQLINISDETAMIVWAQSKVQC